MNDSELIDALRTGDSAAFNHLFRTWYPPLVRLANRMLRDAGVAEELVQDALLELWHRRESMSTSQGTVQAYLFRTVRNRALNHIRHLRIEQRTAPLVAGLAQAVPRADADLRESELAAAIDSAIEELPPRCRQVFELSRVRGLRYAEIAETLGVTVKAVEAQMGKALRHMRDRLDPWLHESPPE